MFSDRLRVSSLLLSAVALVGLLLQATASGAQSPPSIIPDTAPGRTLGTTVTQNGNAYTIGGGTPSGPSSTNLFHSFNQFNLRTIGGTPEKAIFTNSWPFAIRNIISRVTGGASSIDGVIQTDSTLAGANLFLLNPAGVMFGPNASLNVGGSFHVSTADYLKFSRGDKFYSDPSKTSVLSSDPPVAFGFLGPAAPAPITVNGNGSTVLTVPEGQTLSLVGGDITITGATLVAPSGRVQIASVASAGDVVFVTPLGTPDLAVSSFASLGTITVDSSTIDASGIGGGTVVIRGGQLIVTGSLQPSLITANTADADGAPVGIDIRLSGDLSLSDGSLIATETIGSGRSGDVQVVAGHTQVDASAIVTLSCVLNFGTCANGNAGDLMLNVRSLTVTGLGLVGSLSNTGGRAGNVSITATELVSISGKDDTGNHSQVSITVTGVEDEPAARPTLSISAPSLEMHDGGMVLSSATGSGGGAGINLTVGSLTLDGGAKIGSQTGTDAPGGNVKIVATGSVSLSGVESGGSPDDIFGTRSGIFSQCTGNCAGGAGDISLETDILTLKDGARIQNGFALSPRPGKISVTASDSILISNGGGILSQAFSEPVGPITVSALTLTIDNGFISTSTIQGGGAGDIVANVGMLRLTGGGQITSSSEELASKTATGGNISVNATDGVFISGNSGGAPASPFSTDPHSGIFSTAHNLGDAGQIMVATPNLTLMGGGKISVATTGTTPNAGNAGNIALNVGTLTLAGGLIDSSTSGTGHGGTINVTANSLNISGGTGLSSNATSRGDGGDVNVHAGEISLHDGAIVSATSTKAGNAGNLTLASTGPFRIQDSVVTTQATTADGGNIVLTAGRGSMVDVVDSRITTSVQSGLGQGGNITIDPEFVVLDHSQVRADAFGGPGGNINIITDIFLASESIVSASSALNAPGTINIQAQITDVSGSIAPLPAGLLQAATLLRASCAARVATGKSSSLVVAGREGVPMEPGVYLPSPLLALEPGDAGPSRSEGHQWETFPRFSLSALTSACSR